MSNPFRDNIIGMAEDEKATCKGCGSVWYVMHYKGGFCHSCQNDGTYEAHKQSVRFHKATNFIIKAVGICGFIFIIIALIFGHSK